MFPFVEVEVVYVETARKMGTKAFAAYMTSAPSIILVHPHQGTHWSGPDVMKFWAQFEKSPCPHWPPNGNDPVITQDKRALIQTLNGAGVPTIPTVFIDESNVDDWTTALAALPADQKSFFDKAERFVVKSPFSTAGASFRSSDRARLPELIYNQYRKWASPDGEHKHGYIMVQPYIDRMEKKYVICRNNYAEEKEEVRFMNVKHLEASGSKVPFPHNHDSVVKFARNVYDRYSAMPGTQPCPLFRVDVMALPDTTLVVNECESLEALRTPKRIKDLYASETLLYNWLESCVMELLGLTKKDAVASPPRRSVRRKRTKYATASASGPAP